MSREIFNSSIVLIQNKLVDLRFVYEVTETKTDLKPTVAVINHSIIKAYFSINMINNHPAFIESTIFSIYKDIEKREDFKYCNSNRDALINVKEYSEELFKKRLAEFDKYRESIIEYIAKVEKINDITSFDFNVYKQS